MQTEYMHPIIPTLAVHTVHAAKVRIKMQALG